MKPHLRHGPIEQCGSGCPFVGVWWVHLGGIGLSRGIDVLPGKLMSSLEVAEMIRRIKAFGATWGCPILLNGG